MPRKITIIVERLSEGGFTGKALGYAICTEGETFESLKETTRKTVIRYFEGKKVSPPTEITMYRKDNRPGSLGFSEVNLTLSTSNSH